MPKTILLIDDEANVLRALCRALRKENYRIFTARSADECIFIVKAHTVDVIVSDEMMGGMRGTAFLRWIAENFAAIPRILLSGHLSPEVENRAIAECGVYRVFRKPCPVGELADAIRAALDENSKAAAMT
jgi:two-component system, probable response regulator PhcQ